MRYLLPAYRLDRKFILFGKEWKEAAATLDKFLQFDDWKKHDEDPYYDWMLVRKVLIPAKPSTLPMLMSTTYRSNIRSSHYARGMMQEAAWMSWKHQSEPTLLVLNLPGKSMIVVILAKLTSAQIV
jgi:hypothetical protein